MGLDLRRESSGCPVSGEVDGAHVLDEVAEWIGPYLAFPSEHCLPVVTLWAAHTHAVGAFYVTPRLVLDSAEPGSGKTRVLEVLNLVCGSPEMVLSPTTAAIFRMIADKPISLLFDEVEPIFNPKNGGNYEDLRALLNAGYKRGNTIPRCVGDAKKMLVQRFKVFSPVALAGLAGNMPATILTRAVVIHMRKRPVGVSVKSFRERDAEVEAGPVRKALAGWMRHQGKDLANARPKMPDGVEDRAAEVWEALLAIADAAGGDWPDKARAACEHFVLNSSTGGQSLGARLLGDLRAIFGDATAMPTAEIVQKLTALSESPWADLGGKPLDARRLARTLKPYEIEPVPYREEGKTVRGYTTYAVATREATSAGLADAWSRYLPASSRNEGNERNAAGQTRYGNEPDNVTGVTAEQDRVTPVTDGPESVTAEKPPLTSDVTAVTPVTPESGGTCCGARAAAPPPEKAGNDASRNSQTSDTGADQGKPGEQTASHGRVSEASAPSAGHLTRRPTAPNSPTGTALTSENNSLGESASQASQESPPSQVDTCCGARAAAGGPLVPACALCSSSPTFWRAT